MAHFHFFLLERAVVNKLSSQASPPFGSAVSLIHSVATAVNHRFKPLRFKTVSKLGEVIYESNPNTKQADRLRQNSVTE